MRFFYLFMCFNPLKYGGSYLAEVGNLPNFMAENGNIAWFQRISDTKIVIKRKYDILEGRKTEIVNIIVTDIGNQRSWEPPPIVSWNILKVLIFCLSWQFVLQIIKNCFFTFVKAEITKFMYTMFNLDIRSSL